MSFFVRSFEYDNSTLIERWSGIFIVLGFCGKRLFVGNFHNEIKSVCLQVLGSDFIDCVKSYSFLQA